MHLVYSLFFVFAAGFGERFLIHNHIFKLCARADGSIRHTKDCNFNDLRQEWLWTPGNLLMNAQTSMCLQAKKTTVANFLSMMVTQCNSPDLGQKWRCDDSRQLWGTSLDSLNITHAVRYYYQDKYLKARSVKYLVSVGNNWTVFPSNNRSVCSASHNEGNWFNQSACFHNIVQRYPHPQVTIGSLSFTFPGTANGRFELSGLEKFSLNVFVSYFLSCVERIIMYFSFKTESSFTLYCLIP